VYVCRVCAPHGGGTTLGAEAVRFLHAAGTIPPERLSSLSLEPRAARELETAHRRLLNLHLDKELKSVRVLREMRQAR
jgi:hypothetical protein